MGIQSNKRWRAFHRKTKMKLNLRAGGFRQEDHVANQIVHPFFELTVLFRRFGFGEVLFHLALCREFRLELVMAVALQAKEGLLYDRDVCFSKNMCQHCVGDERLDEPGVIKSNAALGELVNVDWKRRHEMSEDAFHRIDRDAPNAKEPKDMVDSESIEIFSHLRKAMFPPGITIGLHSRPIISRKAPVLPLDAEGVRWRAGLHIHPI